jgi:pimeloyl-ACP methyl ester carboxylesterase
MHGALPASRSASCGECRWFPGRRGLVQTAMTPLPLASTQRFTTAAGACSPPRRWSRSGTPAFPSKPPGRLASGLRSALNGAFGDHLAASNNVLAIDMAIHVDGACLPLMPIRCAGPFPAPGKRLCLFIHGLACDEFCWQPGRRGQRFGKLISAPAACRIRLHAALPALQLGPGDQPKTARCWRLLLEELLSAWPQADSELVIVGHSMGGLVALGACEQAMAAAMAMAAVNPDADLSRLAHLGSPLERLGQLANSALNASAITRPLGRIAERAARGSRTCEKAPAGSSSPAAARHRFPFPRRQSERRRRPSARQFIGDGLVPLSSALAHPIEGDVQTATGWASSATWGW